MAKKTKEDIEFFDSLKSELKFNGMEVEWRTTINEEFKMTYHQSL